MIAISCQARRHLDELFILCVVGEFNSGKSSLINALVKVPLAALDTWCVGEVLGV